MSVNDLTFNQLSTVLNDIVGQATGQKPARPTNTAEFVSVAQKGLKAGYDPLATAISQVLSRTIFSVRPYYAKFKGLMVDNLTFGNHVRKLNIADKEWVDEDKFKLVDGESIDQYEVSKPKVVQLNYYGANVYERWDTIYRDQLNCAFTSPEEFASFLAMVTTNAQNMIEQANENTARATVCNLIGGTIADGTENQVIHLVTEYKAFIGESDPDFNVYDPANFSMFARWLFGRIKTISQFMEERSMIYHKNITDGDINRHSPVRDQRLYIYTPEINTIDATVLSNTFNDEYLKLLPYEGVNFWQSIKSPKELNLECSYLNTAGDVATASVNTDKVLGVLLDRDAASMTIVGDSVDNSPYNARGKYFNIFYHFGHRYLNDFSENCAVLLLD